MTKEELQRIKELLEALKRKCKTDTLYHNTVIGLRIIEEEIQRIETK